VLVRTHCDCELVPRMSERISRFLYKNMIFAPFDCNFRLSLIIRQLCDNERKRVAVGSQNYIRMTTDIVVR